MEDLSQQMMPGKPVSPKMRALLNKEENKARKRIIDRGIVHFRADKEFMTALLDAAEHLKIAPGSLCRRIVWEHLKSPYPPMDVATLANELKSGQDEIRGALREIHAQLIGTTKKSRQR